MEKTSPAKFAFFNMTLIMKENPYFSVLNNSSVNPIYWLPHHHPQHDFFVNTKSPYVVLKFINQELG